VLPKVNLDLSLEITLFALENFGARNLADHFHSREVFRRIVTVEVLHMSLQSSFCSGCVITMRTTMFEVTVHMRIKVILGGANIGAKMAEEEILVVRGDTRGQLVR